MNKQGQSILDFINFFPLQAVMVHRRTPISNKEAQSLYSIFRGERNENGSIVMPHDVDSTTIASLTTKEMIENIPTRMASGGITERLVRITAKGKDIIKKIILHTEKSALEEQDSDFDYEAIHHIAGNTNIKTASRQRNESPRNWLERIKWKSS